LRRLRSKLLMKSFHLFRALSLSPAIPSLNLAGLPWVSTSTIVLRSFPRFLSRTTQIIFPH
jgi:hypothetical protein